MPDQQGTEGTAARALEPQGIKWSAPVLIRTVGGQLVISVPAQVVAALQVQEGDILNFTQLPDGAIEVWRVKKSSYASLESMGAAARRADGRPKAAKPANAVKRQHLPKGGRTGGPGTAKGTRK